MRLASQSKTIRSIAEAIGIIEKEAGKMGEEKVTKYCIECNAPVWYFNSKFCKACAEFYNEVSINNEEEETE